MRKFSFLVMFFILFCSLSIAEQVRVNIFYPIKGDAYPKIYPLFPKFESAYIPFGFSVTCRGDHKVKWGIDRITIGSATFYDEIEIQFSYKLPRGSHFFWVRSDCGKNSVRFYVGKIILPKKQNIK